MKPLSIQERLKDLRAERDKIQAQEDSGQEIDKVHMKHITLTIASLHQRSLGLQQIQAERVPAWDVECHTEGSLW